MQQRKVWQDQRPQYYLDKKKIDMEGFLRVGERVIGKKTKKYYVILVGSILYLYREPRQQIPASEFSITTQRPYSFLAALQKVQLIMKCWEDMDSESIITTLGFRLFSFTLKKRINLKHGRRRSTTQLEPLKLQLIMRLEMKQVQGSFLAFTEDRISTQVKKQQLRKSISLSLQSMRKNYSEQRQLFLKH